MTNGFDDAFSEMFVTIPGNIVNKENSTFLTITSITIYLAFQPLKEILRVTDQDPSVIVGSGFRKKFDSGSVFLERYVLDSDPI